jgi:DNA-binding response OmpR family regulator
MHENRVKPKVLVVDDERVIADTLAMILNQSGFDARAVYSGEKAVEMASTFAPDMLITDVIMADLNGIDAAIMIRAIVPKIKILLFSGQSIPRIS